MATGAGIYGSVVLSPKEIELLSIAFDASFTHMYAPGTRRHVRNALKAGASIEEIFEVLKICVAHGVQACNLGVPILEEELAGRPSADDKDRSMTYAASGSGAKGATAASGGAHEGGAVKAKAGPAPDVGDFRVDRAPGATRE